MQFRSLTYLLAMTCLQTGAYAQQNLEVQVQAFPDRTTTNYSQTQESTQQDANRVQVEYYDNNDRPGSSDVNSDRLSSPSLRERISGRDSQDSQDMQDLQREDKDSHVQFGQRSVNTRQNSDRPSSNDYYNTETRQSPAPQPKPIKVKEEHTLVIIKPDGVESNHIGDIISRFEKAGLRVAGIKMVKLTEEQASEFYKEHQERPFYSELTKFMTSGPVVIVTLEGKNAILQSRHMMGTTNPQKAAEGTIRADYAQSTTRNAIHGSDSAEAVNKEIIFFFQPEEVFERY